MPKSALVLATSVSVEADGFQCVREPRQRLMRRAIAGIDGEAVEVRLRNISAMGALVESDRPVAPGTQLTIDIVGVGPMVGIVRWSQAGKFGLQFTENFDIARLAPPKPTREASDDAAALVCRPAGKSGWSRKSSTASAMTLAAPASTLRRKRPGHDQLALGEEARGDQLGLVEGAVLARLAQPASRCAWPS